MRRRPELSWTHILLSCSSHYSLSSLLSNVVGYSLSFLLFKQTQAKQERRETLTRSNIAFATGCLL